MLIKQDSPLILASTSKIRKKILDDVALQFEVVPPFFDEDNSKKDFSNLPPQELALILAEKKALSVSEKFSDSYVIGSDQVCEFEGKEFSKSTDFASALSQLKQFNGKVHYQNNASVIALNNQIVFRNISIVKMQMRSLTIAEIESYIKSDKPFGCAGSYKYESLGKHLFKNVSGDYYSVLGLSIQPIINFLHSKKIISIKV